MPARSWAVIGAGLLLVGSCTGRSAAPADDAVDDETPATDGRAPPLEEVDPDAFDLVVDGALTICTSVPFEPFAFEDAGTTSGYGGFDMDLADELAERMELTLVVAETAFEEITSGSALIDGRCDLAVAAITINDAWARVLDFSVPYYEVKQSLVVDEDSTLAGLADAGGLRIGVQIGMPAERFTDRQAPFDAEVVRFENTTDLLAALDIGEIDAVVQNLPTTTAWIADGVGVRVAESFVTQAAYAVAVREGRDDALLRFVDGHLEDVREDGTRDALLDTYFASPSDAQEAGEQEAPEESTDGSAES